MKRVPIDACLLMPEATPLWCAVRPEKLVTLELQSQLKNKDKPGDHYDCEIDLASAPVLSQSLGCHKKGRQSTKNSQAACRPSPWAVCRSWFQWMLTLRRKLLLNREPPYLHS